MRVVCDANVLISALISSHGAPAQIVETWEPDVLELIVCPKLLGELRDVFTRSKLRDRVNPEAAVKYVDALERGALLLPHPPVKHLVAPDPNDDYLIALAIVGEADYLVSGDRHLTDLVDLTPPVLTPRQFVDLYF